MTSPLGKAANNPNSQMISAKSENAPWAEAAAGIDFRAERTPPVRCVRWMSACCSATDCWHWRVLPTGVGRASGRVANTSRFASMMAPSCSLVGGRARTATGGLCITRYNSTGLAAVSADDAPGFIVLPTDVGGVWRSCTVANYLPADTAIAWSTSVSAKMRSIGPLGAQTVFANASVGNPEF